MKFRFQKKVKYIKYTEFKQMEHNREFEDCWEFLRAIPHGKIISEEQFLYCLEYGRKMGIGGTTDKYQIEHLAYEEVENKYLRLGNHFGGASFYFYVSDQPEPINPIYDFGKVVSCDGYYENFIYGKYGKIDFMN